jgi:hypothetical protein
MQTDRLVRVENDAQRTPDRAVRRQARPLMPLCELRRHFGYSERWWRYRLSEGMPRYKWGRRLRFDPQEVESWLCERYR